MATYDSQSTGLHFHIDDPLGSRRVQLSSTGTVELTCSNLPFGDSLNCTGSGVDATEHHFTGKERDAESGLDYFGARYYGSSMGRFMSPDPFIPFNLKEDKFEAWIANPQHWNKYAYALNNPLKFTDPTGMTETIYYFLNSNLTKDERAWVGAHMSAIQGAIRDKLQAAGIKDVVFRNGSQLSSKEIHAIEAARPSSVGFLNFVNTDYPRAGPGATGSSPSRYGLTAGVGSAVLVGNLDTGGESDSELVFRISEVGSHELGHGMRFYSHDWGAANFFYNMFSHDLMNEGQGMPDSKHPEFFDMTIPQNKRIVDEINQQPPYSPQQ